MELAKYYLLIFFSTVALFGYAQPNPGSLEERNNLRIDAKFLIGFWETADSLRHRIEFVDSSFEIVLNPKSIGPGYRFRKDSLNKVPLSGFFLNWPPYDCYLKIIAADSLEISYSIIGDTTNKIKYVRVRK